MGFIKVLGGWGTFEPDFVAAERIHRLLEQVVIGGRKPSHVKLFPLNRDIGSLEDRFDRGGSLMADTITRDQRDVILSSGLGTNKVLIDRGLRTNLNS